MQDSIIEKITTKIEEIGIANEPGSILYSGNETVCKGDIYFMGANPGGHSDQFSNKIEDTILNQLKEKIHTHHLMNILMLDGKNQTVCQHPLVKHYFRKELSFYFKIFF